MNASDREFLRETLWLMIDRDIIDIASMYASRFNKIINDPDDQAGMLTAFKHAANSIGKATGVVRKHVDHNEAAQSVCGDHLYIEMISEAEERFKRQAVENDQLKAQVERLLTFTQEVMHHCVDNGAYEREWDLLQDETSSQSLAEHDAALLEGFGNKMLAVNNDDNLIGTAATYEYYQSVAEDLFQEAARIRQEALSNG
jgi:hypothetical protein